MKDANDVQVTNTQHTQEKQKRKDIQPFWMKKVDNFRDVMSNVKHITDKNIKFNISETSGTVKIGIFSGNHYGDVQKFVEDNKIEFYSLRAKNDRPLKYVLR